MEKINQQIKLLLFWFSSKRQINEMLPPLNTGEVQVDTGWIKYGLISLHLEFPPSSCCRLPVEWQELECREIGLNLYDTR